MRILLAAALAACVLNAQEKPLTELPYTPGLDPKFMDRGVDPCVDFYKFSCGNWSKLNPIPADQARWDVYSKLAQDNEQFLWGILQEAAKPSAKRTANEQKTGDDFAACMDEPAIEAAGLKPLAAGLARIEALKTNGDITSYVASEMKDGVDANILFRVFVQPDYDNSSKMMAAVFSGGLGLPDRDYFTKTDPKSIEIRQRYTQHVTQMLRLSGEPEADAASGSAAVLAIETALAQATLTRVEMRNPYNLKHRFTRAKLQALAPRIAWPAFWRTLNAPAFNELNVSEPKFFAAVNSTLADFPMTAWRAYFRWHLVHAYAPSLSAAFVSANFDFYSKYLNGVKAPPPRWKKCTRVVDDQLGDALGQVFVSRAFSNETKQSTLRLTKQIETEMGADIESLSWMSPATKKEALLKLRAIINKIGYPDKWRDYSSVKILRGDFLGNVRRASEYENRRELQKIGKPVDRFEWFMSPPTVNAYYDPQTNDINFPAGVLQPPLYDPKLDAAPGYGNTGATVGHELTHGFDDEGRQFDAAGNLKDWWQPADAKAFGERVACVRDQYAQYIAVDDVHVNSKLTLGEDVADLGGTLLAYLAWKHATAGQKLEARDGLTPSQRFFVGMAQWACGEERTESKRSSAKVDPHSPLQFRVNGVVSNMAEFGEAFGCKVGQPMRRENACRVW